MLGIAGGLRIDWDWTIYLYILSLRITCVVVAELVYSGYYYLPLVTTGAGQAGGTREH